MTTKYCSTSNLSKLEALRWHIEMGVDETIENRPIDRYKLNNPSGPLTKSPSEEYELSQAEDRHQTIAPSEGARDAIKIAANAKSLNDLRKRLNNFEGCTLKFTATNTVFGEGNLTSDLMLIGEAPGVDEDRQGTPFVGASGKLLDKMLTALGRQRDSVYISNILFWRPPGNRSPTDAETASCLPFVRRQIELIHPNVLVLLGGVSAKTLLGRKEGIMRLRGKWYDYKSSRLNYSIPAIPTFHPAFLLRQAAQKREMWQDLLTIQKKLEDIK